MIKWCGYLLYKKINKANNKNEKENKRYKWRVRGSPGSRLYLKKVFCKNVNCKYDRLIETWMCLRTCKSLIIIKKDLNSYKKKMYKMNISIRQTDRILVLIVSALEKYKTHTMNTMSHVSWRYIKPYKFPLVVKLS